MIRRSIRLQHFRTTGLNFFSSSRLSESDQVSFYVVCRKYPELGIRLNFYAGHVVIGQQYYVVEYCNPEFVRLVHEEIRRLTREMVHS